MQTDILGNSTSTEADAIKTSGKVCCLVLHTL